VRMFCQVPGHPVGDPARLRQQASRRLELLTMDAADAAGARADQLARAGKRLLTRLVLALQRLTRPGLDGLEIDHSSVISRRSLLVPLFSVFVIRGSIILRGVYQRGG